MEITIYIYLYINLPDINIGGVLQLGVYTSAKEEILGQSESSIVLYCGVQI